ncbi:MAG: hypothetical protein M0R39_02010 [Prolixibacteraceae bacterium]|nr:hypothetical protein [Prolixibacteraceae bacterium]
MRNYFFGIILLAGSLFMQSTVVKGIGVPSENKGKTYLQESMVRVQLPGQGKMNIVKLVKMGGAIVAVSTDQVFFLEKGKWRMEPIPGRWQTANLDVDGKLWLGGIGKMCRVGDRKELLMPVEATKDTILSMLWIDEKSLLVGTSKGAWQWSGIWQKMNDFESFSVRQLIRGKGEELWAATNGGLFRKIAGRWVNLSYAVMSPGLGLNYFSLSTGASTDEIYFGCEPAVGLISEKGDHQLFSGDDGLPVGPVTSIVKSGDKLWLGTPRGAVCKIKGSWRYYAGKRWLDDNRVNDILALEANRVWVATPEGINELRNSPLTLEQKAAYFEERLNKRHLHYGFASECRFKELSDTTLFTHSTNDNDGLWTSIYLAAECFRYSVTGEKDAYENAVRTFLAMEKLETITPIGGYVARSYVLIDESTGHGGEWHVSADGKWKWKGDTSSDEIVGHMFAYPLFYDLVAKGEMKERAKGLVDRLMTHIVDHNFQLIDLDGIPTRWGVWAPDSLNNSKIWMYEKGINSLQILAFLKAAWHVTQNPKYEKAYSFLVSKHHYLDNMLVQKMYGPYEVNHSDDELSFLPYYTLMRYGKESPDMEIYTKSLARSWKAEEADRIPIWNYIASIGLGKGCGLEVADEEMQQIPLDIRNWPMYNSHRWDIKKSAITDRFFKPQATKPIPTPERAISKWNSNTYQMDGGGDGLSEDDGAFFLLPYWMARYHKLLN